MREIKQLTGFQTSDGEVFDNVYDARKAQALLDITEMFDKAGLNEDARDWILATWNELEELMWVRETGRDPEYRDEV